MKESIILSLLSMHKICPLLFLKESNKRGEWNFSQKLIKGEALIRVSRVEKKPKINKRASPFIRKVRVINLWQKVKSL